MMRKEVPLGVEKACRRALALLLVAGVLPSGVAHAQASAAGASGTPVITLEEAVHRAQANEPSYAASLAEMRMAKLDRSIARAGLLPDATYHNQYLYTQPNGTANQAGQTGSQAAPIFIANNAVREYASQGVFNETLGLAQVAEVKRADAAAAVAAAELEVARRGLVTAVTGLFYGVIAADNRLRIAKEAEAEAADFVSLTTKREQQRESAHADVVKAQLQKQARGRELSDAQVSAEKARLELGVLLFPDPRTPFTVQGEDNVAALATKADVEQAAAKGNPELKSALASLTQSGAEVLAARAAYLPSLGLNYTYGIDAPQFAVNGPDGVRNLGYSASVTLDIPVWDWLATQHKVKQSEIRRDAAKVVLTAAQRRLIAQIDETYSEAAAARDQLASLDASEQTAAESLRLTKLRYTAGEATVLEVVDAQGAYLTAANAREDGRVRYRTALAQLQTLTGTM
ncbi:TolC family protein [Occallatibacter riparius]|uniref:TolC family protein n=1 Tax=Occallatibacter riparius TaxID=1002689 RepID=A0A9J7BSX1_9BACT|nr:TolC family protein [Occallatibacter riparius]UWZ84850.1 TolC family protein [Occallatibacter riparius]